MEHYFISKEHSKDDYFVFNTNVCGVTFNIKSCDSVFSKDVVDYGTNLLIKTVLKQDNVVGKILDVGCGYGIIGMALAKLLSNVSITACDINKTAVELTRENVISNHIKNFDKILESNAYDMIDGKFNFIITNPPIKAGKENLLNILVGAKEHLLDNGELWFVIKKKHGEDSIRKILTTVFSIVEIIERDKGYYIIRAVK